MFDYTKTFNFSGKNIVVTGGLGLIGMSVCDAFLDYGANVIVADIDKKAFAGYKKKKKSNKKLIFCDFDITDPVKIKKEFKDMVRRRKKIDVWVNLAYPRTPGWGEKKNEMSFDAWDENVRMHLGGYFWISKLVLEQMKKQKEGSLINFGSIYGVVGPNFDVYKGTGMIMPAAYSAIKGAIVNLSRYFASMYGPYNVRVNTVCPGGIENDQPRRFIRQYSKKTPMKRMGKPEEIAMPVVFLASKGASYINGHTLMVDGGWTSQ